MAASSGDSVTRRSVASQFFTQEEGPGIDGMTTSERVSTERGVEWGGLGPLQGDPPLAGRSQECCRSWPDLPFTLLPGGRSLEPGSTDHQRLKDHSAQTGEGKRVTPG